MLFEMDALELSEQAEVLMGKVDRLRFEDAGFIDQSDDESQDLQARAAELLRQARELDQACEVSLAARQRYFDEAVADPERKKAEASELEWFADQMERIERTQVRAKTAISMLKLL